MRISCLYIGRVGDLIVATPLLRALRRRYPKARIRLFIGWRGVQVPPLIPFIDESVVLAKPLNILAHLKLARSLSGQEDLLVDLNSSFSKTSTMLAQAVRAPVKVAFAKPRGPNPFTLLVPAPAEKEHMYDRYARMASALDAPYEQRPELRLPAEDVEEADRLLGSRATETGFKVLIHPGNFDRVSFRWAEEKFVELTDRLFADRTLHLYYMGGPGEHEKVNAIVSKLKVSVPVLPAARLGVTGAMLKRMDLFVCNITGTTHLAAALDVATFGFYAGYTQAVWRPRGARHGGTVCPEWESCRETTVDEAFTALTAHIARLRPPL